MQSWYDEYGDRESQRWSKAGLPGCRALLTDAGLVDVELSASGFLVEGLEIPEIGSAEWEWLLEAELAASVESPGAGTHIIAWAKVPAEAARK